MSRWKSSLAGSLLINCLLLTGGAVYLNYSAPEADAKPEAIEMEIVSDDATPSAPQISAPKQQKVDIPPPPTKEEVQQMVKDSANTIPVEDKKVDEKPQEKPIQQNQNNSNTNENNNNNNSNNNNGNNNGNDKPKESQAHGPRRLSTPTPSIPKIPSGQHVNDLVVARITISSDGSVSDVTLTESSGYGPADDAIISTLYGWSFYPATDDDGNPITVTVPQRIPLDIN